MTGMARGKAIAHPTVKDVQACHALSRHDLLLQAVSTLANTLHAYLSLPFATAREAKKLGLPPVSARA